MYDYEAEREIVGYAYNANGFPTHAASIIPDPEPLITEEGFAARFSNAGMKASIRVIREPWLAHLRDEYYELKRETRMEEAWERFSEEFRTDDAVELFIRYARIFHPRAVVYHKTLRTGYSQGDWVELILWLEADEIDRQWTAYQARDMPLVVRQAKATEYAYECLKGHCEEFEKACTGDAYGIALHEITVTSIDELKLGECVEVIFELGEPDDECWGYIGYEYAVEAAKELLPK